MTRVNDDGDIEKHVADFLARTHAEHAVAPVRYADRSGAFLESVLEVLFGDALPIVPDANVLRANIGRACRDGHRPVLITGANTGTFRLFCAEHVLEEVAEHSERWASEFKIPPEAYVGCWREHFLPHIRLVKTTKLGDLLSPEECERIDKLRLRDPDDVPSATLALALGAFYVTEDATARLAVYGVEANAAERNNWLAALRCAGDAGELYKLVAIASAVPTLSVAGVWNFGRWLYQRYPWALAIGAGIGLFLAARVKKETYRAIGTTLGDGFLRFADGVIRPYNENIERLRAMLPTLPAWEELVATNSRDSVLMRACLHTLARSRKSPMTVRDLTEELPELGIGQNAQRVGKMLHNNECFFEPYRGYWQVGHAIVRAPSGEVP
jgi:predicted nucleic acid-binding protein